MKTVIIKNKRMSQATKVTIGVILLIGAGVGGYLWYVHSNKKDENNTTGGSTDTSKTDQVLPSAVNNPSYVSSGTNNNYTSSTPKSTTNSPSLLPKNVQDFQDWMDSNHPNWLDDGTSLNKSILKGYGIGRNQTKKAYAKYGSVYEAIKSLKIQDLTAYIKSGKNPVGKNVYSKYAGADIFDGKVNDNIYNKLGKTTKAQVLGKIAKVIPSKTGYWVVFGAGNGNFYKMYSSNLDLLA